MHEEPLHASAEAAVFGDPAPRVTTSSGGTTPSIQTAESPLGVRKLVVGWSRLVDCVNDLVVVNVSLVDIVCDVLVTIEFYQQRKWAFFWISMLIFLLAQCSYAFLFSATWAKTKGRWGQLAWFFAVLPFSQLVPFFAYVETFHMDCLDKSIRWLGLTPTEDLRCAVGATEESLWGYIQSKYQAHAGFLVEAFVEAIPQCVLQTVAIIIYGEASALNILSILISIIVVASKGYLVSYSIDRTTFIFNYLCIVADCFGLIASFTWLFAGSSSDGIRIFDGTADGPTMVWGWLCLLGMGLSCVGGFFLLWFTIFDDHLKTRQPDKYSLVCASVWFEYYLARLVGWCLAIVPVTVVYVTSRFALVPILLLRSLDPEYASKADFYRPLFEFLQYPHQRRHQQQAQGAGQFGQTSASARACARACRLLLPGEQSSLPVAPLPRAVGTRLPGRQHLSSVGAEDSTTGNSIGPGPLPENTQQKKFEPQSVAISSNFEQQTRLDDESSDPADADTVYRSGGAGAGASAGAGAGAGAGRHEEILCRDIPSDIPSATKDSSATEDTVPMAMAVDNEATAGLYQNSDVQSTHRSASLPMPGKAVDPAEMKKLDCTSSDKDGDEDGDDGDGDDGEGDDGEGDDGEGAGHPTIGSGAGGGSGGHKEGYKERWEHNLSSDSCRFCETKFSLLTRRHHCRACGKLICGTCSKFRVVRYRKPGEAEKTKEKRVCTMCFETFNTQRVVDVREVHEACGEVESALEQTGGGERAGPAGSAGAGAGAGGSDDNAGGSGDNASRAVQRVLAQHDWVGVVIPDEQHVSGNSAGRARMTRVVVVPTDLSWEEELALRLKVANQFLLQARTALPHLSNRLSNLRGSGATRTKRLRVIFIEWLKSVGKAKRAVASRPWQTEAAVVADSQEDDTLASAVAAADADDAAERAAARHRLRRLNMERKLERAMGAQWANVLSRSAVLTQLLQPDAVDGSGGDAGADGGSSGVDNILALCGLVCAALVFLIAVAWVPTTAAFLVYGAIYPFIESGRCTSFTSASSTAPALLDNSSSTDSGAGSSAGLELQCALTGIYMSTVCVLCCLAPAVYRFQSLWADLLCVKDFPPVFYTRAREYGVIAELWGRYRDAKDKRAMEKVLDARLGSQLCKYAKKFVAKGW
jgi:hypothetical protein